MDETYIQSPHTHWLNRQVLRRGSQVLALQIFALGLAVDNRVVLVVNCSHSKIIAPRLTMRVALKAPLLVPLSTAARSATAADQARLRGQFAHSPTASRTILAPGQRFLLWADSCDPAWDRKQ
jgi:hypothetical protein